MASELIAGLRGGAAEREAAYAELLRREAAHNNASASSGASASESGSTAASASTFADIAVACTSPLCEVLCKGISEVNVEEYRRACQVLTALSGSDPARVGGECCKLGQCNLWAKDGVCMTADRARGISLAR